MRIDTLHAELTMSIAEKQTTLGAVEDIDIIKRRCLRSRPKTPVRRIGQLEGHPEKSGVLAGEYRLPLVSRTCAPIQDPPAPPLKPRHTIRKIGRQDCLRKPSLDSDFVPTSPSISDSETLVGSDVSPSMGTRRLSLNSVDSSSSSSSSSASSPRSYHSALSDIKLGRDHRDSRWENCELKTLDAKMQRSIEMQICLDLLKQGLSSTLLPNDSTTSTSALQLWLMIEAYESMKYRLKQELTLRKLGPADTGGVISPTYTFEVLDHWLEALYSLYNIATLKDHSLVVKNKAET